MGPAFPPVPISGLRAPSLGLGEDMPFPPWVSFQSVLFSSEGVMLRLPSSPPCFLGVRLLGAAGVGRVSGGARRAWSGVQHGHACAAVGSPCRVQQELPPGPAPPGCRPGAGSGRSSSPELAQPGGKISGSSPLRWVDSYTAKAAGLEESGVGMQSGESA